MISLVLIGYILGGLSRIIAHVVALLELQLFLADDFSKSMDRLHRQIDLLCR